MLSYQFTDIVVCLLSSLLKYAAARINDGNLIVITVSTRSRAEVAAGNLAVRILAFGVSTHSRAKAAAPLKYREVYHYDVSTHSRVEAAALFIVKE